MIQWILQRNLLLELSHLGHKYQILPLTNYTRCVINNNIVLSLENVISVLQDVDEYRRNAESVSLSRNTTVSNVKLWIDEFDFLPF